MKKVTITLPFRLPTWNQLLAMTHYERKKIRDLIKDAVSTSITGAGGSVIRMVSASSTRLTDLWLAHYYEMITPTSLKKYRKAKRLEKLMKQS